MSKGLFLADVKIQSINISGGVNNDKTSAYSEAEIELEGSLIQFHRENIFSNKKQPINVTITARFVSKEELLNNSLDVGASMKNCIGSIQWNVEKRNVSVTLDLPIEMMNSIISLKNEIIEFHTHPACIINPDKTYIVTNNIRRAKFIIKLWAKE